MQLAAAHDEIAELKREVRILEQARVSGDWPAAPRRGDGTVRAAAAGGELAPSSTGTAARDWQQRAHPPASTATRRWAGGVDDDRPASQPEEQEGHGAMRPGPRNAWDTPSGRLAREPPAAARAKSRAVQDSHARCADASAGDDALDYLGGTGGGYFGYAEAFAGVDDGSDAGDGLGPSASGYASEDVLEGEGQYANDRGGYSDHEFDDRELDLEARVAAAEAEAEATAGEEEVAEAAAAQLRGHSRQHAATILSSNPYFEQVGEDEGRPVQEDAHPDGKLERLYRSGRCEVLYATGTRKEVMPSGLHTVFFCNGDVKQTAPSRRVVYYHAEADTTHVSEPDGTQIYHFPNQQVERHFTDGLKEISFPDGMVKVILPNGDVQTIPTISKREPQQPTRQPVGAR